MLDLWAEHFADRTWIGIMPIGGNLLRWTGDDGLSAAKEALGGSHIPGWTEHRIDQIAFAVNRPIQITPLAFYFHVRLIDVPAPACFSLPFAADVLGQQRSKAFFPLPYGFMGELEAAKQEHLRQIPQAQLVQQPAEHDLEDDVCGKLEEVEWSAGSLIGLASAVATSKDSVAEFGAAIQVPDCG